MVLPVHFTKNSLCEAIHKLKSRRLAVCGGSGIYSVVLKYKVLVAIGTWYFKMWIYMFRAYGSRFVFALTSTD